MSIQNVGPTPQGPVVPPTLPASVERAPSTPAPPADSVSLGDPCVAPSFKPVPGSPQFDLMAVRPGDVATPSGKQHVADEMLAHLGQWPSLSGVVALTPDAQGNTSLLVASRPDAGEGSRLQGVYEVIQRLASSTAMKVAAAQHPVAYAAAQAFDAAGQVMTVRLPGSQDDQFLATALAQGGRSNQSDQLQALVDGLPKGKRVVLSIGGPSAAGKSSLIKTIRQMAGDRKVVEFPGDMYFRDADDPEIARTAAGSPYWDHPSAMRFDAMSADIVKLVKEGHADIPVYDFGATRPGGWKAPTVGSGMRVEKVTTPTDMGSDDILVIDSIHATNASVIKDLDQLGLPHFSVYLDSERAEDRLVRRLVRDFAERGRSVERTLSDWDNATFPGEVHFVRPTLTQLDPAQDVFMTTKFPKDMGISREVIEHKLAEQKKYGLMPTYDAFATQDEGLAAFAKTERTRLEGILADSGAKEADKKLAQKGLEMMQAAGH